MTQPWVALGEAVNISKDRIEPSDYPDRMFNFVGLETIEGHTGNLLSHPLTSGNEIKSTKNVFKPGQILYGKLRPYLNKVHLANADGICSTDIYVLEPKANRADAAYVAYFLRSPNVLGVVENLMEGANLPRINQDNLLGIEIPLPPLDEQRRIVSILDEAEALRQLRARADERMAEFIPALFNQMFGDPATNPKGWPSFALDDVCDKITDGTHNSPPNTDSGIPYITAKHLRPYGLDFSLDPTYISPEDHRGIYTRCDPKCGDVLYIKDGVTTGLAAINNYDFEFSMLSSLALLRSNANICVPEYLWAWLNNPSVNYVMLQDMAGAAIKRLTIVKIKRAKILIPLLSLQHEFAARVAEARALQDQQARSRARLDAGFQALLHRAFAGEL